MILFLQFKKDFLAMFNTTDDGEATDYLGCEIISNRQAGSIMLRQQGGTLCVLKVLGALPVLVPSISRKRTACSSTSAEWWTAGAPTASLAPLVETSSWGWVLRL